MDGGPKSLKAGLKLDDEGRDGEGTEDPAREREGRGGHVNCEEKLISKHFSFKVKENVQF